MLKQLKDVPGDVQVEAVFSERGNEACEHLDAVRAAPKVLADGRAGEIVSFSLEQAFPMGGRRWGTAASFITSVTSSTDTFYGTVVQQLQEWAPTAPKQNEQPRADTADTEAEFPREFLFEPAPPSFA